MQTDNPILDGLAQFFTDAAGAAQSVRTEIDTFMRQRLEKLVADMDFVPREEFEAVKAMAAKARSRKRDASKPASPRSKRVSQSRRPKAIRGLTRSLKSVMGRLNRSPTPDAGDSCVTTKSCVR